MHLPSVSLILFVNSPSLLEVRGLTSVDKHWESSCREDKLLSIHIYYK